MFRLCSDEAVEDLPVTEHVHGGYGLDVEGLGDRRVGVDVHFRQEHPPALFGDDGCRGVGRRGCLRVFP